MPKGPFTQLSQDEGNERDREAHLGWQKQEVIVLSPLQVEGAGGRGRVVGGEVYPRPERWHLRAPLLCPPGSVAKQVQPQRNRVRPSCVLLVLLTWGAHSWGAGVEVCSK